MRKNQKPNLFVPILFAVSLALISINTSHLSLFLSTYQTYEGSTISVIDTPKLSWGIEWSNEGKPICTESTFQTKLQICSDGGGGAIITWRDYRSASTDIYAQRVSSSGVIQWTVDGVAICMEGNQQSEPQICSDGGGGAIITWRDSRGANDDIYAQRVNSNGVVQWAADGVAICTASNTQIQPQICGDGSGGAIIMWIDYRGADADIYAQRVNSNGVVQWTTDGVAICTAIHNQGEPQICSVEGGSAIITWKDSRSGSDYDIYAQLISSSGAIQWTVNGVTICTASGEQRESQICKDGGGGAIITWRDYRGADADIYAQRVNSIGVVQWTTDGVTICTESDNQYDPRICSNGGGGAIITWRDYRGGSYYDIYAQLISSSGAIQWTVNGVTICTESNNKQDPQICGDGSGGAIITWSDYRSGSNYDIYAQRVNSNGIVQWDDNGTAICTESNNKFEPQICGDGSGSAIITWEEYKSGSNYDIYAQRIKNSVPTSNDPADITTSINGTETINWTLCDDSGGDRYRVLANGTNGNLYTWVDWTTWTNNTLFSVSINRTTPGVYDYSIEYYDDQGTYGVSDTVIVTVEAKIESTSISFGYYFLPFSFIGLIFIIISWRRKINHK
jgi:predicted lipoprotein with Yx(FWY)xxD motif